MGYVRVGSGRRDGEIDPSRGEAQTAPPKGRSKVVRREPWPRRQRIRAPGLALLLCGCMTLNKSQASLILTLQLKGEAGSMRQACRGGARLDAHELQ